MEEPDEDVVDSPELEEADEEEDDDDDDEEQLLEEFFDDIELAGEAEDDVNKPLPLSNGKCCCCSCCSVC